MPLRTFAEQVTSREASAQGLVFTCEMLNSVKAAAVEKGTGWILGNIYYEALLQINYMKTPSYSRMPLVWINSDSNR